MTERDTNLKRLFPWALFLVLAFGFSSGAMVVGHARAQNGFLLQECRMSWPPQ